MSETTPPKHGTEDEQVQSPVNCKFGPANNDRPLVRRILPPFGGFLLGFLATSFLSVFFHPIVGEVAEWRDQLFCPNILWCNTHLEFKATNDAQCSIGSIGTLVNQAIMDGDLVGKEYHKMKKSLAARTYLCDDVSWSKKKAVSHLSELDDFYDSCFDYTKQHEKESRHAKLITFKVHPGRESTACISNIWKNSMTGGLETTNNHKKSFVFCMPYRDVNQRMYSAEYQLPRCTNQDLQAAGIPDSILAQ